MQLTQTLLLTILAASGIVCHKHQKTKKFEVEYEWTYINFTWKSETDYQNAINTKTYIPENNAISGFKFYKDSFYFALPRICSGTPVTLAYFSTKNTTPKTGPLLIPFPDWKTNDVNNPSCDKLVNVQSLEIDANGVMWVLDATRQTPSKCPPKLVLYDLNNKGKTVHTYIFPDDVCLHNGGFLNDIVIDDSDGTFAYIPDTSFIDPGLVVYSKTKNRAWKLRDASMFPEMKAADFVVNGDLVNKLYPIDGIALSPKVSSGSRRVYYSSLTGVKLYSIGTELLKNEKVFSGDGWRRNVEYVGTKQAQGDGMVMDNVGVLYYGLLPLDAVEKWNTNEPLKKAEIVDQNYKTMIWPDSFCFDSSGNLYVLADAIHRLLLTNCAFNSSQNYVKYRILKYFTGTQSYLYRAK
ncbi:hypothetical protein Zmor_007598 [Zophobas morio]|uniref:Uncharacterized protein n=1 Tax=Zophobas morio TaxID=2755281 RepID=A0AA38IVT2_9CUCU|nr:hypothetical protein Zmor_007598 [Zophobas morio]